MSHTALPRLAPLPLLLRVTFAATALCAAAVQAAPDHAAASDTTVVAMAVVTINGTAQDAPYAVQRTRGATKTDTALRDLPQTITVITPELIRDQSMQSMADLARYVPGISMSNGEGNRDAPIFRGSSSASGDFYIDGVRDDVEYFRDLYDVERVEALTGPAAMIFGRGGSGGVINRVPKQADWSNGRAVDLTLGAWQKRRLTADIAQAINDTAALRVTGLEEGSGGYQRNATLKRSAIHPTLALRTGSDSSVVLGYEHFEDERSADRGVPSLRGRPLDLPVSAFFGDPDPKTRMTSVSSDALSSVIELGLANGAHLTNRTRYTDYDKIYQNYNAGAVNAQTGRVAMSAYNNHQWRQNLFNQTDLVFKLDHGAIRQQVLLGMELGRQDTDYLRKTGVFANGATSTTVALANPDAPLPVNYVLGGSNSDRDGSSKARIAGLYVQDQIAFSPQWQVIAGVRYDSFRLDYHNNRAAGIGALQPAVADLSSDDKLLSPRLGLVYKPAEAATLYANYSVANFPRGGDQLSSLNSVNQGLKPEQFINYEVGAKVELRPALLATVALYRLNRNNVAVVNPQTGIADQLVDGQRTNGVEIGLSGKIGRHWSIQGGYAHQDAKLLATASATALSGATVGQVPRNTFSLWNRYDATRALGIGLGVIYRDAMFASTSNAVTLPGYTRVDAALFYTVNTNLSVQLNVENLLDRQYYAYANGDNNITPGSPRALRVGLHATF